MVSVDVKPKVSFLSLFGFCGRKAQSFLFSGTVSRRDLAVRRLAGKQKDLGTIRFGSPFSSKIAVYGHCLLTLPTHLMKH